MRGCAYFGRKLTIPIEPKMGPGAILETLQDCAKFVGHMHRWRHELAAELILKAAKSGRRSDVDAAEGQMKRALRCDGWL